MTWLLSVPLAELAVALPLAACLLAVLAGRFAAGLILVTGPLLLIQAGLLIMQLNAFGPLNSPLGGWTPPLGIALGADGFSGTFIAAAALIMTVTGLYARRPFATNTGESARSFTFWPLFFAMWTALNVIFLGRDLFSIYVALELLTLAAIGMVAYGGTAPALRYMTFALMGSLAYLTGVALLYASAGTMDIDLLATLVEPQRATMLAGGLMTAGLLAKTALFPLHAWLPPAHGNAPATASALLSALVIKASFFVTVRIWFSVMPEAQSQWLIQTLGALGAAAVLIGSLLAIRQERLKLVIAYSTVAQIGYLFFIFPLSDGSAFALPWAAGAWSGGMFHAVAHAFAKAALFLAAGIVIEAVGHDRIRDLTGLARALPVTFTAFGIAAVSIMGLPPSGGFMAKYLLLTSALEGGQVIYALVMIVGGLLAAVYMFRPLSRAFTGTGMPQIKAVATGRQLLPLSLALVSLVLGLASSAPYEFLQIGLPDAVEDVVD